MRLRDTLPHRVDKDIFFCADALFEWQQLFLERESIAHKHFTLRGTNEVKQI